MGINFQPLRVEPAQDESEITCATCEACCCRLEVLLITDTGVPERFTETDPWGGTVMARLEDGWCAALDRGTMRCRIYPQRPWVCREFQMGGSDCIAERGSLGGTDRALAIDPTD
jgi:Fe-S-cluster containining protein